MENEKHTPTPIDKAIAVMKRQIAWNRENNYDDTYVDSRTTPLITTIEMESIVRAVNNHQALIDALTLFIEFGKNHILESSDSYESYVFRQCKEALKKATWQPKTENMSNVMKEFKFYDSGLKDFIRDDFGEPLVKEFGSYEEADEFVARGGLNEYGWTNEGTKLWVDEDQE